MLGLVLSGVRPISESAELLIVPALIGMLYFVLLGVPLSRLRRGLKKRRLALLTLSAGSPFRREMRANKLIIFFCILIMSARLKELADLGTTLRACGDLSGR
ncbi:hypothetical protein [Methermicoccus shengliensis]|uniref:hypothetical protein n=1 Tax=Methermicoccus shengliensis TaxID=660064 RepID=UPI0005B2C898|nr:hypothetical protein [Methermicoccus shengliensis]